MILKLSLMGACSAPLALLAPMSPRVHVGLLSPARFTRSCGNSVSWGPAQPRSLYSLRCHREFTLCCRPPVTACAPRSARAQPAPGGPVHHIAERMQLGGLCSQGALSFPMNTPNLNHSQVSFSFHFQIFFSPFQKQVSLK